jgi:hypothetical protein
MKKNLFLAVILTVCFVSCTKDEFSNEGNEMLPVETSAVDVIYKADPDANVLRSFGKALYESLIESPMLREIIKTKALEQFDRDYDVLYQIIKNEAVENGLTVRKLLLKHFENEDVLKQIETKHPTLTIFVPILPENSFSAEIWNTTEQIPAVAIRANHHNTPAIGEYGFIDANSDEFAIEAGYIPAFPIVVIKDNERVAVAQNTVQTQSAIASKDSDFAFEFIDECFDGSKKEEVTPQKFVRSIDPKLEEAYYIHNKVDGWQRDYIYYGLTQENTKGPFSYDFQEHITSFRFSPNANPYAILEEISDQSRDPAFKPIFGTSATFYPWTDGYFEFRILAQHGVTVGIDKELEVFFHASPDELFEVTYRKIGTGTIGGSFYLAVVTGFKEKTLKIPLINWDLDKFSPIMKIHIEEQDDTETETTSFSYTAEYAGNFDYDIGWGETVKIGLKFGASAKKTHTHTYQRTVSHTSDNLGDIMIEFAHNIVLGPSSIKPPLIGYIQGWDITEYDNGMYAITVMPVRVQY